MMVSNLDKTFLCIILNNHYIYIVRRVSKSRNYAYIQREGRYMQMRTKGIYIYRITLNDCIADIHKPYS